MMNTFGFLLANITLISSLTTLLIAFIVLIIIIIIEILLFQRWLHMRTPRVRIAVIIANCASAFLGPIVTMLLLSMANIPFLKDLFLESIVFLFFVLFLVTILIEFLVNSLIIRKTRVINIFKTTLKVNLITYALLVLWTGLIFIDSAAPPKVPRRRTAADMRAIGTALGSYQVDYNIFPIQPVLGDMEDIGLPLIYYEGTFRDSWKTPFKYISDGENYSLISYGKDRQPGGEEEIEVDIVYSNGEFVAPPSLVDR